jgi:hypothetical protein
MHCSNTILSGHLYSNKPFITMETQHTKPGYVRLILETDKSRTCKKISSSCHNYDGKLYISSTNYKEYIIPSLGIKAEVHGPCTTVTNGVIADDSTTCLSCTAQPAAVMNLKFSYMFCFYPFLISIEHILV